MHDKSDVFQNACQVIANSPTLFHQLNSFLTTEDSPLVCELKRSVMTTDISLMDVSALVERYQNHPKPHGKNVAFTQIPIAHRVDYHSNRLCSP